MRAGQTLYTTRSDAPAESAPTTRAFHFLVLPLPLSPPSLPFFFFLSPIILIHLVPEIELLCTLDQQTGTFYAAAKILRPEYTPAVASRTSRTSDSRPSSLTPPRPFGKQAASVLPHHTSPLCTRTRCVCCGRRASLRSNTTPSALAQPVRVRAYRALPVLTAPSLALAAATPARSQSASAAARSSPPSCARVLFVFAAPSLFAVTAAVVRMRPTPPRALHIAAPPAAPLCPRSVLSFVPCATDDVSGSSCPVPPTPVRYASYAHAELTAGVSPRILSAGPRSFRTTATSGCLARARHPLMAAPTIPTSSFAGPAPSSSHNAHAAPPHPRSPSSRASRTLVRPRRPLRCCRPRSSPCIIIVFGVDASALVLLQMCCVALVALFAARVVCPARRARSRRAGCVCRRSSPPSSSRTPLPPRPRPLVHTPALASVLVRAAHITPSAAPLHRRTRCARGGCALASSLAPPCSAHTLFTGSPPSLAVRTEAPHSFTLRTDAVPPPSSFAMLPSALLAMPLAARRSVLVHPTDLASSSLGAAPLAVSPIPSPCLPPSLLVVRHNSARRAITPASSFVAAVARRAPRRSLY
ncbi:hypothetical protein DFH09DRAFT_1344057 [Mycena vulgaris]|nr:hypothetical protein DFH09DRAFT_1344057 [Mycena vulgaris]